MKRVKERRTRLEPLEERKGLDRIRVERKILNMLEEATCGGYKRPRKPPVWELDMSVVSGTD